jgi:threonine/homoserine/homoserine lactone efflux protein
VLPTDHVLAFALISFVLIIVPGPNVLFVISRSLMLGRAAGVGTAVGGQIGVYLQVTAVAVGIGALVERSVAVFTVIKLVGAAYLIFLGVQAWRHRGSLRAALDTPVQPRSLARILWDGTVVGASNPKAIVFFVAVLPQFVNRSAGTARAWITRSPRRLAMVGGTGGLAMIGIGASLALTGRKD